VSKRGLTLTELMVVIAISLILSVAIYWVMRASGFFFKENKEISDLIEQIRSAEAQLSYYFNRWGVGVPEDPTSGNCDFDWDGGSYPSSRYCMSVIAGSSCDEITFYGSVRGYLVVLGEDPDDETRYKAYACDILTENNAYYYLWKPGSSGTERPYELEGSPVIITGDALHLQGNPKKCVLEDVSLGNVTIPKELTDANGNTISLQPGDLIMRIPKVITIDCAYTDGVRYLRIKEQEADERPSYMPLVPVKRFKVSLIPEGCDPAAGKCVGIKADVQYRYKLEDEEKVIEKTLILTR